MAYKFQLGAARLSGSTTFEQPLVVEDSFSATSLSASAGLQVGGTVELDGVVDVTADVAADSFYVLDATDGLMKRESMSAYATTIAGDGLVAGSGVLSIDIADMATAMTGDVADADEFAISDGGTMKKVDFSVVRDAVFADVSGDATVAAGGALTIGADKVLGTMLNTSVADTSTIELSSDTLSVLKVPNAITVDNATLQLDSGTTYDGAAGRTISIKDGGVDADALAASVAGAGLTGGGGSALAVQLSGAIAFAGADHIGLSGSVAGAGLSFQGGEESISKLDMSIGEFSTVQVASGDKFLMLDSDGSTHQLETVDSLSEFQAGLGLGHASGVLSVDLNELSAGAVNVANDSIAIIDADDSNASKKETISDFVTAIANTSAGVASLNGQLGVNSGDGLKINGSNQLVVEPADIAGFGLEDDGSDNLQISTAAAGVGLSGGGGAALALDLNELSAGAVDVSADSIAIIDANDSNASKKESIADLVSGMAGSGLSASGGQLSIPNNGVTEKDFSDDFTAVVGYNVPDANAMGKAIDVTMPAPQLGAKVTIKAPPSCSSTFTITISGASMDGATSLVLEGPGAAVSLVNVHEGNDTWIIV